MSLFSTSADRHGGKKERADEEVFEKADEKTGNSLLYSMVMGNYTFGSRITGINDMPINDKLFILQSDIIKSAADKGPCVIIGRCGDYILREYDNVFRVFIHANKEALHQAHFEQRSVR